MCSSSPSCQKSPLRLAYALLLLQFAGIYFPGPRRERVPQTSSVPESKAETRFATCHILNSIAAPVNPVFLISKNSLCKPAHPCTNGQERSSFIHTKVCNLPK